MRHFPAVLRQARVGARNAPPCRPHVPRHSWRWRARPRERRDAFARYQTHPRGRAPVPLAGGLRLARGPLPEAQPPLQEARPGSPAPDRRGRATERTAGTRRPRCRGGSSRSPWSSDSTNRSLSAVARATAMGSGRPVDIKRVRRPEDKADPPTSSRVATKAALASGNGIPSSVKKVTVLSKWAHLPRPVRKKAQPTTRRVRSGARKDERGGDPQPELGGADPGRGRA